MKLKFEFFDVTADVGFRAYGSSLEEVFQNAALAMFEVMTDTSQIQPKLRRRITLKAEDEGSLLYDWLTELLLLLDSEYLVFSKFEVIIRRKASGYSLEGTVWGDEFDPSIHQSRDEVKAVTYHLMDIKKDDRYMVQVILDI